MSIQISDPLSLLPYQSGLVAPPLTEGAAQGQSDLDAQQRAIVLGEPVPIVFCRRVDSIGGVFVSPGATEGRFENDDTTNELTVNFQLVLSEGDMPQLELRDVFQRACRVGTWAQTYDRRAGTWTPGNFITSVVGTEFWNCPYYCGTSGTYDNLTTLSYTNTHPDGDDTWNKQVHCFVRNGVEVERIIDETTGSSNNVVDLALYLIRQSSRFPESLIDEVAMLAAAEFTNENQLYYNGEFKESGNLEDWLQQISFNFLLRISDNNGKKGFRPRLPVNEDHTIKTTKIDWVFGFTEEHLLPDGFEIEYIPLSERKPICAQVLWRQQPDNDIGIIRSTEVRFAGEAIDGPFEQYDLSQFCASENHAVKIGAYIVARRKYIAHTLRLRVKPDAFNSTLTLGDIVRVQLRRETSTDSVGSHNFLYEVERINKNVSGVVELDLIHFPVDAEGRSLVARQVAAAVGAGFLLPTGREDFSCDIDGRDDDDTPLADEGGILPDLPDSEDFEYELPDLRPDPEAPIDPNFPNDFSGEAPPGGELDNPADPLTPLSPSDPAFNLGDAKEGDTISVTPGCPGASLYWYRIPKNDSTWDPIEGRILDYTQKVLVFTETNVSGPGSLTMTADDIDYIIYAEYRCPDPSQPDGLGAPVPAGNTNPVEPDVSLYQYIRLTGTYTNPSQSRPFTSEWVSYGGATDGTGTAVSGMRRGSTIINPGNEDYRDYYSIPVYSAPWRASLAITQFNVALPTPLSIGLVFGWTGWFTAVVANSPGGVSAINAQWQFSNDQSTVLRSWTGR
jgi:hypothetical protein